MSIDSTTLFGSGTVTDPKRSALLYKQVDAEGNVTYYTTGGKLLDVELVTEAPDLSNSYSGIYIQLPEEEINNG